MVIWTFQDDLTMEADMYVEFVNLDSDYMWVNKLRSIKYLVF